MQNHTIAIHALSEIERLEGVVQPENPLPPADRRGLIQIWGGPHHAHRQRAEIMHRSHLDQAVLDSPENARDKAKPGPVRKLDVFKAQIRQLAQHGVTVLMTVGIPTTGDGKFHDTERFKEKPHASGKRNLRLQIVKKNPRRGCGRDSQNKMGAEPYWFS
jgi:hypothetical protein